MDLQSFPMVTEVNHIRTPLLTAVVPIYKMDDQLETLLNWLSEETLEQVRVVLVHDEVDLVESPKIDALVFSRKHRNFNYIRGNFGSPGLARNRGLEFIENNSDWISFWDSDDSPEIEEYLKMLRMADLDSKSIAVGGYAIRKHESNELLQKRAMTKNRVSTIGRNVGIWRWAFKSQIIRGFRFQDFRMGEDQDFLFELNPKNNQVFFHRGFVYNYIQGRAGQVTANLARILEIENSYQYLLKKIISTPLLISVFQLRILQGQFLTTIKYGNSKTRLTTIFLTGILPFRILMSFIRLKNRRQNDK